MKVKINEQLICIPPHISTTWDQVTFLQSEEDPITHLHTLAIHLTDQKEVRICNLDVSVIDIAFSAHIKHLEKKRGTPNSKSGDESKNVIGSLLQQLTGLSPEQLANTPIRFGIAGLEGMPGMEILQHSQNQAHAPDMPHEILDKIVGMIKMMTHGEVASFPKPEPHCNCPHCQVARSLHGMINTEWTSADKPVADEELTFRNWDIVKQGDQLYSVTNPLDPREHYNVYLGSPVGCTCGTTHCEHIKAVLYS